ncbi:hypothetical protein BDP81DRAFT_431952 [Colletotrichum phormii]|uniref:Secreted protein n=1 Tax=Colletotrichum phormii TaxID=359342 RepID=A0AAJ0EF98_9PEZI|nr:uncharacterized protein BDP81DRAFT_431952 [Colletotrichum phormii]KAK1634765.1 hypothetical protein BDP81DRAFT_431952 [Colletotrichum phormii]
MRCRLASLYIVLLLFRSSSLQALSDDKIKPKRSVDMWHRDGLRGEARDVFVLAAYRPFYLTVDHSLPGYGLWFDCLFILSPSDEETPDTVVATDHLQ